MQNKFPTALRATLVGMPPTRAPHPTRDQLAGLAASGTTDGDMLGAQAVEQICRDYLDVIAELSAAKATTASLHRQLALKVEAFSFTVQVVAPAEPVDQADFDEPTRQRRPAIIRREPVTKVLAVPGVQQ